MALFKSNKPNNLHGGSQFIDIALTNKLTAQAQPLTLGHTVCACGKL